MGKIFLISIAILFFILGHSTIVYFAAREKEILSIRELISPWPKQGKTVSLLCVFLSIVAITLAVLHPSSISDSLPRALPILLALGLFPLLIYVFYIKSNIYRCADGLCFRPQENKFSWTTPILIAAIITVVSWLFK